MCRMRASAQKEEGDPQQTFHPLTGLLSKCNGGPEPHSSGGEGAFRWDASWGRGLLRFSPRRCTSAWGAWSSHGSACWETRSGERETSPSGAPHATGSGEEKMGKKRLFHCSLNCPGVLQWAGGYAPHSALLLKRDGCLIHTTRVHLQGAPEVVCSAVPSM